MQFSKAEARNRIWRGESILANGRCIYFDPGALALVIEYPETNELPDLVEHFDDAWEIFTKETKSDETSK